MEKQQLDHLEQRLHKERDRVIRALRQLDDSVGNNEEDGDLTTMPFHLADEGTDTMEQEQSFLLMSKEGRLLIDIDEALRRLYRDGDNFGKCTECGSEIAFERLDLVPWARTCVDCQREIESRPPVIAAEASEEAA